MARIQLKFVPQILSTLTGPGGSLFGSSSMTSAGDRAVRISIEADRDSSEPLWPGSMSPFLRVSHCLSHGRGGNLESRSLRRETQPQRDHIICILFDSD